MARAPTGVAEANLRSAATVVLIREVADGLETCLLQRHSKAGFVPGAHVFPGGLIEPDDDTAEAFVGGGGERVPATAAVRECFEECGIIPGLRGSVDSTLRRDLLSAAMTFGEVLQSCGATVDLSALRPISRWVTPVGSPRRYDTWFFVAQVPPDSTADPDGTEIVGHRWCSATEALEADERGEITMIMPTRRTLARLSQFSTASEALAGLPFASPTEPILTERAIHEGRAVFSVVGDPEGVGGLYDPDTTEPLLS